MKKLITVSLLLLAAVILVQCQNNHEKHDDNHEARFIKPVDFPDTKIPGFKFPEDSSVINGWIDAQDNDKIAAHAWGIWTGLNMPAHQKYEGQELRVFETWLTPEDIQGLITAEMDGKSLAMEQVKTHRGTMHTPHQFLHKARMKGLMQGMGVNVDSIDQSNIIGFVKYDPSATSFTVKHKLLDSMVLQKMWDDGVKEIPEFPNTAITLKPSFETFNPDADTFKQWNGCYRLNAWTGLPDTPISYAEGNWPGWVYVDPNNKGKGNGSVDTGQGQTPENTYNLDDFIHFKLDAGTARQLSETSGRKAKANDIAILVAMHVTTKETKRWTWQTFWWAPNPDNPPAPSSAAIASLRPKELKGAPRHYAMAPAYTFIYPNQPNSGGNNIGTSIYAFNPYLEAGFTFGPVGSNAALNDPAYVITNGKKVDNNWGIRTNCMSCHAHANFAPATVAQTQLPQYLGDTYVDLHDTIYGKALKLDFAWSIQGNMFNPPKKK